MLEGSRCEDVRLNLSKDQISFLEANSNVMCQSGEKYYFMPFWFERREGEDVFKRHSLGHLPKKITDFVEMCRNETIEELSIQRPLNEKDCFKKK
jgi:hypothetical protein